MCILCLKACPFSGVFREVPVFVPLYAADLVSNKDEYGRRTFPGISKLTTVTMMDILNRFYNLKPFVHTLMRIGTASSRLHRRV